MRPADRAALERWWTWLALLASPAGVVVAADDGAPRQLGGSAIRSAFSGRIFADGSHFRWSYKADGTTEGVSLGKRLHGRWRVVGDRLCDTTGGVEICSTVRISGQVVSLIRDGADVSLDGTLR